MRGESRLPLLFHVNLYWTDISVVFFMVAISLGAIVSETLAAVVLTLMKTIRLLLY